MASLKERVTGSIQRVRERYPSVDHALRTIQHYGSVNGTAQAGAVTFFGFLSVFPILALALSVIGLISRVSPDLRDGLIVEIGNLFPGVIGDQPGEIPLSTIEGYAGTAGPVGLLALLYAGLGWLSGMRAALRVMFVKPAAEKASFLVGKARDLATLTLVGLTLVLSVALSGVVSGFSQRIIVFVGLDPDAFLPELALRGIAYALAIAASTVLLVTMFTLLARPHAPRISLVKGALLGAVGFELLKALALLLIAQTKGQPSFQAFGVALVVVVWINYFSRLVMLAAAWAYTSPGAVAQRRREAMRAPGAAFTNNVGAVEAEAGSGGEPGGGEPGGGEPAGVEPQASAGRGRKAALAGAAGVAVVGAAIAGWRKS